MEINLGKRPSRDGKKIYYSLESGKEAAGRWATDISTFAKPKRILEKNHNKEALLILEAKKFQLALENQTTRTGVILAHKYKRNFLDYYKFV